MSVHGHALLERSPLERELVRATPLIAGPPGADGSGPLAGVRIKLENLQRTGSFKLRGAARKLARLSNAERVRGVVAASAGNHGAGLALAASRARIPATVVVPKHAPKIKKRRIADMGAQIVVHGATYDHAEAYAKKLADEISSVFVSPYDDDDIIEGNGGTLADELWQQCGSELTAVVCPVGGGGLIAGLAQRLAPRGVRVIGVQPKANCAMHDSLELDRALTVYTGGQTLAEGCEGAVSERTYALVRNHVERIALVDEDAIRRAVAFCYREMGTVVECSAAVAVAGFLEQSVEHRGAGTTVCVVTGGNIEPELLDNILASC